MLWGPFSKHLGVAKTCFLTKTNLVKTNHAKPLRQPQVILVYRVYLKHRNSILKFRTSSKKNGLDFGKTRCPFLSMLPCGRPRSSKITMSLFVDVALRAASILKNHDLLYLFNFLHVAKLFYLLGFERREYARSVSFEKCYRMHQSTSQMDVWRPSYDHISCMVRVRQGSCSVTFPIVGMRNDFHPPSSLPPGGKKSLSKVPQNLNLACH